MSDPARSRFGHDVLRTFDTQDARDFLADVIESSRASSETEELLQQSLVADSEDWRYLIDCAESLQRLRGYDHQSLDGQDVATYVWKIWNGLEPPPTSEPWEATDRLIARAKELERDPEIRPPSSVGLLNTQRQRRRDSEVGLPYSQPPKSAKRHLTTSHYWSDQPQDQRPQESHRWSIPAQLPLLNLAQGCMPMASQIADNGNINYVSTQLYLQSQINSPDEPVQGQCSNQIRALENWTGLLEDQSLGVKHVSSTSPYFTPPISTPEQKPAKKRPPRGTISAVPFAPLASPTFGLIQEVFAHEPFWLLIAVTFLIRTKGLHAIPVFYKFKERFPTPMAVVDPANTDELVGMIRHLGLSVHRVALMQKYAQGFLHNPPRAGKTYKVKNYDQRDFDPSAKVSTPSEEPEEHDLEAWEIGHLTKGKYAIDSWRIFCRDELLGRATDWNGGGREPEFQPEWMRVRPDDKELRAYLRWMWMKEGWEWDPVSGERTVLREEMQRAVNEGRVEYDDTGGLKILDEPREGWMDSGVLNAGL
ncbi:hypothetical protein N0V84_006498 [Fusarium piperis]|uniref:Methyl-CpG-binding domain-containing protein 4 n=1 Tax=Fusarium piperis TaxID=1435070 RepID=A0A9W9BN68_9HYPO|nr:hypothetical protein N0V84_006498 [Fusarium piperis]